MAVLDEQQLRQQLDWVRCRLAALEVIAAKLQQMRELALSARDQQLEPEKRQELNCRIQELQLEVADLDRQTAAS